MMDTITLALWVLMKLFAVGAGIGAGICLVAWFVRRMDRLEMAKFRGAYMDASADPSRVIHMQDQLARRRQAEGAR